MADVTFTVDGKKLTAPAGTLLIDACRTAGIEIPAFCYYPNLSLQAACRMCVVRIEKIPKLQTACTTPVAEGMVVQTETEEIKQSRKAMLELLLGNHPLDCPVCDAGGECELQDMTFKYGAGESKYVETKQHREEQQWSPVVFYDRPRCILCYRCVRVCGEGMDVWALAVENRGASAVIAPNQGDQLDCEECGMCIDICPVGALTSETYRYKTRPWEMNHVGTVCAHCGDGCKTTLGMRRADDGMEIVRADNRDKSGINNDFLCLKGRYAFDFANHTERLTKPLVRGADGKLAPVSWEEALDFAAKKLAEVRDTRGGKAIGVIGSNRTTNEENYLLQKLARGVLKTNNIDHHRTADYAAFAAALKGHAGREASLRDFFDAPAILLLGNNPTEQHPALAWQIRSNVRLHRSRLYVANHEHIKLRRQAKAVADIPQTAYPALVQYLAGHDSALESNESLASFREAIRKEESLLIAFGSEYRGRDIQALVEFALSLPNAKIACLGDYANSRGAADMGMLPDLLPGYVPVTAPGHFAEEYGALPTEPGLDLVEMFDAAGAGDLAALYIVGSNPVARYGVDPSALKNTFLVVQDMFLTETAVLADVVFPAANLYEKAGTATNTYGDLQLVKKGADKSGVRADFEIIVRMAAKLGANPRAFVPVGKGVRADFGQTRGAQSGEADRHQVWLAAHSLEPKLSPFDPFAIFDEIQRLVPAYDVPRLDLLLGNDEHVKSELVQIDGTVVRRDLVLPANDHLATSGTLGRYSAKLTEVANSPTMLTSAEETAAD
ncbi:NADH-quinone oxidoreductase subunit NuoG [Silvibacterium dinghuense]|uniref:NADH dehydrogenase (Quinone) subunit G n=1 Tax=Silvibacterium dinghuense TaxID=1560006 RepID=A0A4Q1SDI4_9BACT|nr:NADH-quinone oxidoreductase subunit NuoG [Silvibacterium dinghuense]RXS95163.1 NADH dehydrogenase (quinone) subunit G [Silvibacterium dinghuense]GGH11205.1 NADH-quinone oxidoreductase [Silvibacterium dinghuense]